MIADKLRELIAASTGTPANQIKLQHPDLDSHGDYAFFAQGDASTIAGKIKADFIDRVEAVGGFVNIWLKPEFLLETAELPQIGQGKTVVVEYSSPNIAKPFGIGHLRSTIIGQALFNIYRSLGYNTIGDNHLGDWGTQFGKLLFMIDRAKPKKLSIDSLEKLYVEFHQHPEWEAEGQKWFKKLEDGDPDARKIWQECVDISLLEFDRVYKLLDVTIDNAYGESSYEGVMSEVVADAKKIAKVSEGATIIEIPGEKTPLMLLKSDGATTYATRDLATIKFRSLKWHPDLVLYEVGAEQALHFRQVFAVAKLLGYVSDVNSLIHIKHGLYLAPDGKKFSTRKGKTIKLDEVLQEAITKARNNQAVGIGAIKYFDLSHNTSSDIVFDWDTILAQEGNSGPYLQYTYARIHSVLAKATVKPASHPIDFSPEELSIIRFLYRYPEAVVETAMRFAPNLLCNFLYELCQRYNTFYNKHKIADHGFRLFLSKQVAEVLQSGLTLLGIAAPEHMWDEKIYLLQIK